MAFLPISLLAISLALVAADDSCPSAAQLKPCTCDGEGINCMAAETLDEIRKAFRAKFKYGGVRSVFIQGTPIPNVPKDLFGNATSQEFFIEVNSITSVDVNAFSASKTTLEKLSLYGNKINSFEFSALAQFERLNLLNLQNNKITSIPDKAFNSKSLGTIMLSQNQISNIGLNAFSGVTNLFKLQLSNNRLQTIGPMAFASNAHAASLQIELSSNMISSVSTTAFNGTAPYFVNFSRNRLNSVPFGSFGKLIERIAQKGGYMDLTGNPFTCRGCDYSWVVLNQDLLQRKFQGFRCTDGRTLKQLTYSNIGCSN